MCDDFEQQKVLASSGCEFSDSSRERESAILQWKESPRTDVGLGKAFRESTSSFEASSCDSLVYDSLAYKANRSSACIAKQIAKKTAGQIAGSYRRVPSERH